MDIGVYYHKDLESIPLPSNFAFGINISNLGSPISYSQEDQKTSIPANLRIGSSIEISPKQKNSFALNFDLNKLLVGSPPIYDQAEVLRGMPAADNYFMELIQSFYDAPGISYSDGSYSTVLREELSELILNCGLEYSYAGLFCLRVGYFYESEFKGGRQYLSLGGGLKYKSWILDLSIYALGKQSTPLKNTVSISLSKSFS